ncbi:MAG: 3-deoxy-manno-octulosonate cytidylyltransferase [Bacteroidetes bacterium]|nr:3-deoxy-manno-octulosonate cytidylyltransferase [Bacteroidota bacterium]
MKILGIIPARYGSTRFPGKPLADIKGKPMIQCVYEQAHQCKALTEVVVATDDKKIESAVKKFGGKVVMTSDKHESGTDRCYEALVNFGGKFNAVINIQGDEPFIHPEQISKVANCFYLTPSPLFRGREVGGEVQIATLVMKLNSIHELTNHNTIKAVINKKKEAIYFSRTAIPYYRGEDFTEWLKLHTYYKHVGIYGYRSDILAEITKLERSPLEIAESLEQLRWLENGYKIVVEFTDIESHSIDTPEDLKKIDSRQ